MKTLRKLNAVIWALVGLGCSSCAWCLWVSTTTAKLIGIIAILVMYAGIAIAIDVQLKELEQ